MIKLSRYCILIPLLFSFCTHRFSLQKRKYSGGYYFARSGDRKHAHNASKRGVVFSAFDFRHDSTKTPVSSPAQASRRDLQELGQKTPSCTADLLNRAPEKDVQKGSYRKTSRRSQTRLLRTAHKTSSAQGKRTVDRSYYTGQDYLWGMLILTAVIVFFMVEDGIISFAVITIAAFVALVIAFIIALVLLLNNLQKD